MLSAIVKLNDGARCLPADLSQTCVGSDLCTTLRVAMPNALENLLILSLTVSLSTGISIPGRQGFCLFYSVVVEIIQ